MFLQASVYEYWRGTHQLIASGRGDPCFEACRWKGAELSEQPHINLIPSPGVQGLHPQCFQGDQHFWLLSCLWWPPCPCGEAGGVPQGVRPSQRRGLVPETMLAGTQHKHGSQWVHYHYLPPCAMPPQLPHHYHTTGRSPQEPSKAWYTHRGRQYSTSTDQLPKIVSRFCQRCDL